MVEWLLLVVHSLETWVRFLHGVDSFCSAAAILRGTEPPSEPVSALTRALFILLRSLYFFFLGFRHWLSSTDRVLTFNMNIRLPLFWSTWSPAKGQDSATCAGLAHGRDYSCCRALELKLQKFLATVFPWIAENTFKQWPTVRIFQPSPTGLDMTSQIQYFDNSHTYFMVDMMIPTNFLSGFLGLKEFLMKTGIWNLICILSKPAKKKTSQFLQIEQ